MLVTSSNSMYSESESFLDPAALEASISSRVASDIVVSRPWGRVNAFGCAGNVASSALVPQAPLTPFESKQLDGNEGGVG